MPYDQTLVEQRDYALTGPNARRAIDLGMASAQGIIRKCRAK